MISQRQPGNESPHHKTRACESHGRAILWVSLTLLISALVSLPNEVSSFVSKCVSSDNLLPSVTQEPTLRPWKGSPFLQHWDLFSSILEAVVKSRDRWKTPSEEQTEASLPCWHSGLTALCLCHPRDSRLEPALSAPASFSCKASCSGLDVADPSFNADS